MIPYIIKINKFPLTPNGKIDVKSLKLPEIKENEKTAPENELEFSILEICKQILKNPNLTVTDDFFIDGEADSLSILSISSRLYKKGIYVKTQDFYTYSSVRKLAKRLENHKNQNVEEKETFIKPRLTFVPKIDKKSLKFEYKNVLLTGTTGFLGIHVLEKLLKLTDCNIYCIIRMKYNQEAKDRLIKAIKYYFDEELYLKYEKRIFAVQGDLSSENFGLDKKTYENLQKKIDCIINCAANVKHYGAKQSFEDANIKVVQELINFAKDKDILLNQISTTSISGENFNNPDLKYNFTENDFYFGQNYKENIYIDTKFRAEEMIIKSEYEGLKANIFRLGNLTARFSDGKFQKGKLSNEFYQKLLAFAKLGEIPKNMKDDKIEFSPVDSTSEAIIDILKIQNIKDQIFHILNNNKIEVSKILEVFSKNGVNCEYVSDEKFIKSIEKNSNDDLMKFMVSDLNKESKKLINSNINIDNRITNEILENVDFKWPKIDENYIQKGLDKSDFWSDLKGINN